MHRTKIYDPPCRIELCSRVPPFLSPSPPFPFRSGVRHRVSRRFESKIIEVYDEAINDVYEVFFFLEIFREFEAESGRLRRTASTRARLEEWPIPDTRVDLTLLYLINYSVRYPILQFVPSHIPSPRLSAPPFLDVARRRLRDLWNPFFFFFLPFSRSTNRPSIESRVCAICVNVNRDRSSIYSTKSKVYLKIDARRIVNERRERGRKWNEFGRFIKKKKDTND